MNRIEVACTAKRLPLLLDHIAEGAVNLTGARLLTPHLTEENAEGLLSAARHKSKREIEELIATLRPRADVASTVRKLPSPRARKMTGAGETVDAKRPETLQVSSEAPLPILTSTSARTVVAPLAPERFKVQFTITRETRDKLRQVQDLMRHTIPNGDPAAIFDRALTMLLEDLQRKRFALTSRPRTSGSVGARARHVPAAVRRTVWRRDGGRCAFVGSDSRCGARDFLEFHHVVPFAVGGAATVENIELRCRAHNAYEATLFFDRETAHGAGEGASDSTL